MILLIHDEPGTIAAIERLLARAGRDVHVVTSVDEAVAAFEGPAVSLILLAPGIESGRGHFVLEERVTRPKVRTVPVLLLGEACAGFDFPIAPMPPTEVLLTQIDALAPSRSVELLAGAERALSKARSDAASVRQASHQSSIELAGQLAAANAELEQEKSDKARLFDTGAELETKLQALQREHEQTQDALATLSREHAEALSRRDALKSKLDAALERAQQRSESAMRNDSELAALRMSSQALTAQVQKLDAELTQERENTQRLEAELAEAREAAKAADLTAAAEQLAEQADQARKQLDTSRESHRIELAALKTRHDQQLEKVMADTEGQLAELQAELERAQLGTSALQEARAAHQAELSELNRQLDEARSGHEAELGQLRAAHADELAEGSKRLSSLHAAHDSALTAAREQHQRDIEPLEQRLLDATSQLDAQRAAIEAERVATAAALDAARAATEATKAEHAAERSRTEAAERDLETARLELQAARAQLAAAQTTLTAERDRAAAAEERAEGALERAKSLESRTHLIAEVEPEAAPLAIPRSGTVAMGELARLAVQLWAARADVRIDLSIAGGTRRLWLRRGALVAAWSSQRSEVLSVRARRDGLIDARAEAELREVRDASPASLLEELRQRGLVRKSEISGLVKRYTEEIALEAFSEAVCTYRLHDEAPGAEVLTAEDTRLLPTLAAQALKRALPWEAQLELLGGPEAVPRSDRAVVDAEALGFNEREQALLQSVDGATSVESLIVESGLKTERGYQVLAVAKVAGLIVVGPPLELPKTPRADPESLEAKYEQVQQTDYFAILGLPRTAGAEDVKAARERLAKQYDPLRWSAHPDPAVLRRARAVFQSIEEAARTLADDRLRAEYARHLIYDPGEPSREA